MVVGLGNPGSRYSETRHNVGFRVVDALARRRGLRWRRYGWLRPLAWVAQDEPIILVKPRTFMNRSGLAVEALCRRHRLEPRSVVAVHDDADLPLGRLRLRKTGGHGGHNGLRSIGSRLESDAYPRVRIGVRGARREGAYLAEYLLSPFDPEEFDRVEPMIERAADAVQTIVEHDIETAMNRFNRQSADPQGQNSLS